MTPETHAAIPAQTDTSILMHDLRNAVAPLLTAIELLRGRTPTPDQLPILDIMASQVTLLTDIIDHHTPGASQPSAESPAYTGAPAPGAANLPGTVLVVDDNPNIIAALQMMFEDRGYIVLAATTAEDAVRITAELKPDLCLCDISLPAMDGFTAASQLIQAHPPLRLFSMSGLDEQIDRQQSRDAGFKAHFKKPIPFDDMIRIIERAS